MQFAGDTDSADESIDPSLRSGWHGL